MKNSLFRIDKDSVAANGEKTAGFVVLPCLKEMMQRTEEEDEMPQDLDADIPFCEEEETNAETEEESRRRELALLEEKIGQARREAEEVIREAEKSAEEIKQKAQGEGYDAGLTQARQQVEEDRARAGESLAGAICALESAADKLYDEMEKGVLDLALCIAEHIIKTEIAGNDDAYKNMIKTMLVGIRNQSNIVLKVGKEEYERFFMEGKNDLAEVAAQSGIRVVQDISLKQGDCLVETEFGYMDAGVLTQLKRLEYSMKQLGTGR